MTEEFSVGSARAAAAEDRLAEWVAEFLSSPGSDNAPLAEQLRQRWPVWAGPVRVPLDQLHRLAGPAGQPVLCVVDDEEWDPRVDDLAGKVADGHEPPPLVATFDGGRLVLEDGNHRAEALRRAGDRHAWAVVGFEGAEARDRMVGVGDPPA